MKRTKCMAIATLLLLGVSGAAAQSLGDYARSVRKNKPEPTTASRHYDNDNLPTGENLSVVGPPPSTDAAAGQAPKAAAVDPAASTAERQQAADDWKKKLDLQKQKVDSLNHELDLDQRELRLRTAALVADPGTRLRNTSQWDKDDAQYKSDTDAKQKALADARQQLDEMQEQAHKAGIVENEKENENNKDNDKK
jgi:hypothetical protein